MHLYCHARAQRQHHHPMKVSETPFRKLNGDPLRIFHSVLYSALPPFLLIAASSYSGVRTHPQPLCTPPSAIHRATQAPPLRQSLPLRTATLRTLSVASRAQHHIPPMASRQQSLKEHLPPPSAVNRRRSKSTDYTFPKRKRRSP